MKEINRKELSLYALTWPIGIEMLLQFVMGTVDTLMVSRIGDNAVAAVGVSNQIIQTLLTLFTVINAGAGIVVAHKWGAGNIHAARQTAVLALKFNLFAGLAASFIFIGAADWLLGLMGVPIEVAGYANIYLTLVGGGAITAVLHMVASAILRSTGNTKAPMQIAIGMNVLHLVLNYVLIFGALGIPAMGLAGAAWSTLISRVLALVILLWLLAKTFPGVWSMEAWRAKGAGLWKEMMRIGLPVSVTAVSWGYSQIILLSVISSMGAANLAAYTYIQTIQQLPWVVAASIGTALQIRVAQFHGASLHREAQQSLAPAVRAGFIAVALLTGLIYAAANPVLGFFTEDDTVIGAAVPVMLLCILWQPLRVIGFCVSGSLNAVGEAKFVALLAVIGMWALMAGGAYLLGISAGLGLVGAYLAMIADEVFRASLYWLKWRKRGKVHERVEQAAAQL